MFGVRTVKIRTLLIFFVMVLVLPAWGFASYLGVRYARTERQIVEASGQTMARGIASLVQYRLKSLEAAMTILSLSPQLDTSNLEAFYVEARAFAATQRVAVGFVSPDGQQVFNTSAPYGASLPPVILAAKTSDALQTGKIQFSSLFRSNVTDAWLMSISIPMVTDQGSSYALVVTAPTIVTWGEILNSVELPPGWILSIADEANIIAARRPNPELFVGQPVHPEALIAISNSANGWASASSRDNKPVYLAFQRVAGAPWTVLVGVPAAAIDGVLWQTLAPVVTGGLAVLMFTVLAAWFFGMRFTAHLSSVSEAASAFRVGKNGVAGVKPTRITELAELKIMLESAAVERSRYESQLRNLLSDKDLLMQEVHHRVKNSLQLVRGILTLQARTLEHPEAKTALNDAATRILTIADVHQHLYQGHSTAEVNVRQYLQDLGRDLNKSLLETAQDRQIDIAATDAIWPSEKIIALGLITTELVTNAIKHGKGNVRVRFDTSADGNSTLVVQDDGPGFPVGFQLGRGGGLGSKLIASLVRQGEGSVKISRGIAGAKVSVVLTSDWRRSPAA